MKLSLLYENELEHVPAPDDSPEAGTALADIVDEALKTNNINALEAAYNLVASSYEHILTKTKYARMLVDKISQLRATRLPRAHNPGNPGFDNSSATLGRR